MSSANNEWRAHIIQCYIPWWRWWRHPHRVGPLWVTWYPAGARPKGSDIYEIIIAIDSHEYITSENIYRAAHFYYSRVFFFLLLLLPLLLFDLKTEHTQVFLLLFRKCRRAVKDQREPPLAVKGGARRAVCLLPAVSPRASLPSFWPHSTLKRCRLSAHRWRNHTARRLFSFCDAADSSPQPPTTTSIFGARRKEMDACCTASRRHCCLLIFYFMYRYASEKCLLRGQIPRYLGLFLEHILYFRWDIPTCNIHDKI